MTQEETRGESATPVFAIYHEDWADGPNGRLRTNGPAGWWIRVPLRGWFRFDPNCSSRYKFVRLLLELLRAEFVCPDGEMLPVIEEKAE